MLGSLEQMISDMEKGVFDYTKDGECSNCGQCCSDILPVSDSEIRKIKRYIQKHGIKEQKHFVPTAQPYMDFTCPFRDNSSRRCVIYEVRPGICRDFRCDKPKRGIKADRSLYERKNNIISMRYVFFMKDKERE